MMRVAIQKQGKVIIERDGDDGFFVMTPTGDVEWVGTRREAEARAKHYFKRAIDPEKIGIGEIEWRT